MKKRLNTSMILAYLGVFALLFFILWFWLYNWLADNVMPLDYDYIDSYEWAQLCCIYLSVYNAICMILVAISLFAAPRCRKPNTAWTYWCILFLISTVIVPIIMASIYPLDGEFFIYCLLWVYCLLASVGGFFTITWFTPFQWGFNPLKK